MADRVFRRSFLSILIILAPLGLGAQEGTATPAAGPGTANRPSFIEFLTADKTVSDLSAYPSGVSKADIGERDGKRWLDFTLKGTAWSGASLSFNKVDLKAYRAHGALQFYARGTRGAGNLSVGFIMATGPGDNDKWALEDTMPINHYAALNQGWTKVTIPLSDFPENGTGYDDRAAAHVTGPFQWGQVIKLVVDHTPGSDPMVAVQFSLIRIIPSYDPREIAREKATLQQ